MSLPDIPFVISSYPQIVHLLIIFTIFCATWGYILCPGKEWLIDDQEGIAPFSDKWDEKKQEVIDFYEVGDKDKKKYKNFQFNKEIGFPSSIIRWLRINLGKKFCTIAKNKKGHDVYGSVQDPRKHHAISFFLHFINIFLCYFVLHHLFGAQIAFMASVLFCVHPVSAQGVAWISGIGYLLCLFGSLAALLVSFHVEQWYVCVPLVFAFCTIASCGLFSGALLFLIFLCLGDYLSALACFWVFLISFFSFGKMFVSHRVTEFKKQNMGHTTTLNARKLIVMIKTFWYYFKLLIFPKRLSLFHTWGYHWTPLMNRVDGMFWKGLITLCVFLAAFILGPLPVKFGICWWIVYLLIFSNFITAMQFVVDRYAFISSLGYSILVSYLLLDYPVLFWFLVGLYMMRTLVYLPAFDNILNFYKYNALNFPNSEVALGNLGVILAGKGKLGSAVDVWNESIKINDYYDVAHYNLSNVYKSHGQMQLAFDHLRKCLNANVVHFEDHWKKEFQELEKIMNASRPLNKHMEELNERYRSLQSWK